MPRWCRLSLSFVSSRLSFPPFSFSRVVPQGRCLLVVAAVFVVIIFHRCCLSLVLCCRPSLSTLHQSRSSVLFLRRQTTPAHTHLPARSRPVQSPARSLVESPRTWLIGSWSSLLLDLPTLLWSDLLLHNQESILFGPPERKTKRKRTEKIEEKETQQPSQEGNQPIRLSLPTLPYCATTTSTSPPHPFGSAKAYSRQASPKCVH